MDLLGTELVVLSASDTGLGEVHVGEGVFGLKRAFALAGAKTVVTSLWKVADQQTRELMEDFYRHLLQGQTRADALREAQLAMKERYPDPLYWGAFVCQANPGQMLKLQRRGAPPRGAELRDAFADRGAAELPSSSGVSRRCFRGLSTRPKCPWASAPRWSSATRRTPR